MLYSTSGMTTTAKSMKHKPAYDPARQWGLKPNAPEGTDGGGSTYVVSGHIVNSSSVLSVSETMGREGQARAARKVDTDRALMALLERDKDGMKAVVKAREFGSSGNSTKKSGANRGASSSKEKEKISASSSTDTTAPKERSTVGSRAFSASVIKQLGFNPTLKNGERPTSGALKDKVCTLIVVILLKECLELTWNVLYSLMPSLRFKLPEVPSS
jgi:minichromosome maintenance protein 10